MRPQAYFVYSVPSFRASKQPCARPTANVRLGPNLGDLHVLELSCAWTTLDPRPRDVSHSPTAFLPEWLPDMLLHVADAAEGIIHQHGNVAVLFGNLPFCDQRSCSLHSPLQFLQSL